MHRALRSVPLTAARILRSLLLAAGWNLTLLLAFPLITQGWTSLLQALVELSGVPAQVLPPSGTLWDGPAGLPAVVPAGPFHPTQTAWNVLAVLTALVFLGTFVPDRGRWLPLIYLVRAGCLLMALSLAYFAYIPVEYFPHGVGDYVGNGLQLGLVLLFVVPWLLAGTYGLLEFSLVQQVKLALLVTAFFVVGVPLQYFLHFAAMHAGTILLMPMLYLLGGLFLDVMMFVALYGYAMTWPLPGERAAKEAP